MSPKLYMTPASPPVRAAMLTAKAINLELDLIDVKLLESEQMKPEYLKLNPLHTVPTLDDNGFVVYDSHAIMIYLVEKYSKEKSLYPEDLQIRTRINQRLFFHSGLLFPRLFSISYPIFFEGVKKVTEKQVQQVNEAYGYVETFLQDGPYFAGNSLSIADFSILTTMTNANVLVPLDERKYPKISEWRKQMKRLNFCVLEETAADLYRSLLNIN